MALIPPLYIHTYIHTYLRTYVHTYVHTYIHTYLHTYLGVRGQDGRGSRAGGVGRDTEQSGTVLLTNEIGTPDPKLEPQISSSDKCKINLNSIRKNSWTTFLGLGSGVPIPSVRSDAALVHVLEAHCFSTCTTHMLSSKPYSGTSASKTALRSCSGVGGAGTPRSFVHVLVIRS